MRGDDAEYKTIWQMWVSLLIGAFLQLPDWLSSYKHCPDAFCFKIKATILFGNILQTNVMLLYAFLPGY